MHAYNDSLLWELKIAIYGIVLLSRGVQLCMGECVAMGTRACDGAVRCNRSNRFFIELVCCGRSYCTDCTLVCWQYQATLAHCIAVGTHSDFFL